MCSSVSRHSELSPLQIKFLSLLVLRLVGFLVGGGGGGGTQPAHRCNACGLCGRTGLTGAVGGLHLGAHESKHRVVFGLATGFLLGVSCSDCWLAALLLLGRALGHFIFSLIGLKRILFTNIFQRP